MHEVGHHLQIEAIKKDGPEKDLFARSAYNRYYYSIFLIAREMLLTLNPDYRQLAHQDYPAILSGSIVKSFKKDRSIAQKNNDYNLFNKIESAISASKNFSELMHRAYATRVVADYQPHEKINFTDNERFYLNGMSITEAHNWLSRATLWRDTIIDAWRQVHD